MPSKKSKTKQPKLASKTPPICGSHAALIIGLLFVALVIVTTLGIVSVKKLENEARTDLDIARLAVFDDMAAEFIKAQEIRSDETVQEMTGYGISDEDDVFYITFNYYTFNDDGSVDPVAHPAIIYFWKDAERGTYSHAFSYPDSPTYHPAGIYVEKSAYRLPLQTN